MSSILETGRNKIKCQKFTPLALVNSMLDLLGYTKNLMGKTILENSFGAGNILKEIVIRYIEEARTAGIVAELISAGLTRDIYGIELDKSLYNDCISDLNAILDSYNIPAVDWKLFNGDALTLDLGVSFDYVIGNPPYISYKEMDRGSRKSLKECFESCAVGKFDYCYAFIELGIRCLKDTGKLVQLIPNNIYKNVFAKKLRELLLPHISVIRDYPNQKLFDKTLTSVSVFLYDKESVSSCVQYENDTADRRKSICRKSLGNKWMFGATESKKKKVRFGDVFHASICIATLYNKAFIVDEQSVNEVELEDGVLRSAVSPNTMRLNKKKRIIFPYRYDNGKLQHYSQYEFRRLFPHAYAYLKKYSVKLKARNSDKNAAWFEYGRSQALAHLNREKLLISTIITNEVKVYKVNATTIPFSGIYITVKDKKYSLDDAVAILESKSFLRYVQNVGISISGKSLRITCKDINDYLI